MLLERKIGMVEAVQLTPEQSMINQLLYEVDLVAHRLTLKWGVNRLLELAPPDLKAKFDNQMGKLEAAVIGGDVALVQELVGGCCRGWQALERAAIAAGHVPHEPLIFEVAVDGVVVPVVRTLEDQHACPKDRHGNATVTLEELCRVFVARQKETFSTVPLNPAFEIKPFKQDMELGL